MRLQLSLDRMSMKLNLKLMHLPVIIISPLVAKFLLRLDRFNSEVAITAYFGHIYFCSDLF